MNKQIKFGVVLGSIFCIGTFEVMAAKGILPPLDANICSQMTGTWDVPSSTCEIKSTVEVNLNNQTGTPGFSLLIPAGTTLLIDASVTFTMNNGFDLFENRGTITNHGSFIDYGIFTNLGTINNGSGAIFDLHFSNPSVSNRGVINNDGTFTFPAANVYNPSTSYNRGTINNYGTLAQPATQRFLNQVNLENRGLIYNVGSFTNAGGILNYGSVLNCGGSISGSGTITKNLPTSSGC